MARRATLATGDTRLVAAPLMGRTLLVGSAPAATGDLALLLAVHRSEPTTSALPSFLRCTFCHLGYPPVSTGWRAPRFSATCYVRIGGNRAPALPYACNPENDN